VKQENIQPLCFMDTTVEDIKLRPLLQEDVTKLLVWHNDKEVTEYSMNALIFPQTLEDCEKFVAQQTTNKMVTLGILVKNMLVGYIGISGINWVNRSGEFFIFIGDKSVWNKGVGYSAGQSILCYAFNTLGLHRVDLSVSEPNIGAVMLYKKLGFIEEGRKRQSCFRNGVFHDKIIMSLLKKEWCGITN
jgi:RimJ/RimL family protein N-acetyltransferase